MDTETQKQKKELPPAMKAKQFKKGQSGNPSGRPAGTGKRQKALAKAAEEARILKTATGARALLNLHAPQITKEIIDIALTPPIEEITEKDGKKIVRMVYGQNKVKCLLACFDRIIPVLKVAQLEESPDGKRPADMTDGEIVLLMERMVNMAQNANPEALDG